MFEMDHIRKRQVTLKRETMNEFQYKIVSVCMDRAYVEFTGPENLRSVKIILYHSDATSDVNPDAEQVCRILKNAYDAGKRERSREIRELIKDGEF